MKTLVTKGISKYFFGIAAVEDVDVEISEGEIVGLIGPNGSGKTTLFNCVTGFYRADGGRVFLRGRDITNLSPHAIARLGLARTFQLVRVFPTLTVRETLLLALQEHQERSLARRVLRAPSVRRYERFGEKRARELVEFVGLNRYWDAPGGNLSYGQQKLLAFCFSLMADPEVVLLDEPAAAINPTTINGMKERIRQLNADGKTFFIVEHNMEVIMDISHRVIVLDYGRKIAEGAPEEVVRNEEVIEAYFGR